MTKFIPNIIMIWVTPKAAAKLEVLFKQPEAGLLNKKLMLSLSSRCDQIYEYELYDLGHTLLCYLSWT